jgi:hypothetical protein
MNRRANHTRFDTIRTDLTDPTETAGFRLTFVPRLPKIKERGCVSRATGAVMLRLLGSQRQLCDGLTRRDLLHIGGLGMYGLTLGNAPILQAAVDDPAALAPGFGKAKRCIMPWKFKANSAAFRHHCPVSRSAKVCRRPLVLPID